MKRKHKWIVVILLFTIIGIGGCGEVQLTEIPFTEYSLVETNCRWVNFDLDKVIIINSQSEMDNSITCTDGSYPEIDFSENTLLLAKGGTTNGVSEIISTVFKKSEQDYALNVTVHLDLTYVAQGWHIYILIPKISNLSKITLDVKQTYY
jgi:hypothetical protein